MKYRPTRTRDHIVVALCATVLCLGFTVQAQVTHFSDDFESYGVGTYTNLGYWAGEDGAITITNYTYSFIPSAGYPLPGSTHEKVLAIEGNVTNDLSQLASSPQQETATWLDLLVKPTFMGEDEDYPADLPTNAQTAVVFDYEGHLHIHHFVYTNNPATFDFSGEHVWSAVGSQYSVKEGEWVRLTIENDYDFGNSIATHFQVYINGTVVTNENAYVDPGDQMAPDFSTNGTWFVIATRDGTDVPEAERYRLNAIALQGTGSFDDVVVTDFAPTFESFVYYEITPSVMGNGTITPNEVQYVLEGEDSAEFTFAPASGYMLTNVVTISEGVTNNLGTPPAYTFTNVMANAEIIAYFVVDSAEGQPSSEWFAVTSIEPEELGNNRGDGMTYREAWLASINPNDTNETFRILGTWRDGGSNYVQWVSTYVDDTLPPFAIWARTNLMDTTYDLVGEHPRVAADPISDPVTNTWAGEAPAYPIYYRVVATNTPPEP